MNSEVDQFGRSTNNSDVLNDDKSKRILEALSDIKNQLQNDEFIPKVEKENISRIKDIKKDTNHDLDFKNLHYKIESLEKKINQIVENLQNNQKGGLKKEEELEEEDQSIFHKIENNNSDQNQSKSIIVLENQNLQNISSFKFYHFLILLIILLVVLTLIISNNLGLTISESLNFFLSLVS
jgi:Txe/YoeB family toxin of Txe-Axe toxin-antitoxin module